MNADSGHEQFGDFLEESFDFKEITWNIHIFSLPNRMGFKVQSPQFSLADATWELQLYPNGSDQESQGYISLAIEKLHSQTLEHYVMYKFEIQTRNGKKTFSQFNNEWFKGDGNMWISSYYLLKSKLYAMKNIIAPHGILTIVCQMRIKKTASTSSQLSSVGIPQHPGNKTLQDFKDLFLNQDQCDIIIKVRGQEFPAHKAILIARSPVFASTFRNEIKKIHWYTIEECDPSSFSDFLYFLYCGKVEKLSIENVFSLFTTADKYEVQDLRLQCLEFIKKINLSVDTFCDIVTLAIQHSEKELIKSTTDFFAKHLQKVIVTDKWRRFVIAYPAQSNEIMIKALVSKKK